MNSDINKGVDRFDKFFEKFVNGELLPPNRRHRILVESQYVFPSSGDKAIMDLYALYTLWFELGGGKSAYGYEETNIRNFKLTERVKRYFEEALAVVCKIILEETKQAIAEEADYVFDNVLFSPEKAREAGVNPLKEIVLWFKEAGMLRKFQTTYHDGLNVAEDWFKEFDYNETIAVFNAPFWRHANLYGGKKWADITEVTKDLDAAYRRGNEKDLMYNLDKFMDLEHNTGSLFTKLDKMKVENNTLNKRAGFRSAQEFLPYVSPQVAGLIKASVGS
jgi:hypothetical protein